ncbi:ATP-binding protein [Nocardia iowensis]|uniref:LuxR C-terminal-related transcriptional regulator n=1 Tax=Nocardia iowensis TaxID=204891 RepID=A0ABX8RY80_NOCIO|nr:AAA family ATPase [Nocardia iowensis]QXN94612.1 LuxR C-terminal-related transcriptional regulator [Nocardia iowensis]
MPTAESRRGDGLPTPTDEFVGRNAELARISALLSGTTRLITLVGPGGIGKTRLAAEAMRRFRAQQQRPVFWARLARLRRPDDVLEEVVRSVARIDVAGRSAWDVLVDTFGASDPGPTVLVLDNCEHVLTGAFALVTKLLEVVPGLTILAASREPIGWMDEQVVLVAALPPGDSLALFRHRAELTGRPILDDPEQLAIAKEICRHVDHNPLFLQLAAARLLHRPPAGVLGELTGGADDRRLRWSYGARAGVDERHRSVRDVIAWSYDLCPEPERLLLDRMAVFAAGFETDTEDPHHNGAELEAVSAVCAGGGLMPDEIEPLLERLVERSLVAVHLTTTTVRFYLQESVRLFAWERLRERSLGGVSEARTLANRHRRYYRDKVTAGGALWDQSPDEWLRWARPAFDNVLLAIEQSLDDPDEAVIGLEIAVALMSLHVPFVQGAHRAMIRLTEHALRTTGGAQPAPTGLRVKAMALIAWSALWQGRQAYAAQLLDDCATAWLSEDDARRGWRVNPEVDIGLPPDVECTWALELLLIHMDLRSMTVFARAQRKFAAAGEGSGAERSQLFIAFACAYLGSAEQALDVTRHQLESVLASGSVWAISWAEIARAIALANHGQPEEAQEIARDAVARSYPTGDVWTTNSAMGAYLIALGRKLTDRQAAGANPAELTAIAREIVHIGAGFAARYRALGIEFDRVPMITAQMRPIIEATNAVLGEAETVAAAIRGSQLRPEHDDLPRYVLGSVTVDRELVEIEDRWHRLSAAERDVAVLVAANWPNSAIAARRGSSVRTVDAQVSTIRQKLSVASRSHIVRHIPAELVAQVRHEAENRPRNLRQRG